MTWNWCDDYDDGTRVCHIHFLKYHAREGLCPSCLFDLHARTNHAMAQAKRSKEALEAEIKEREAMWGIEES